MNQKVTIIILSAVLVLLIAVSVSLYNSFSENYVEETDSVTGTGNVPDETKEVLLTKDFVVTDMSGNEVKLSDFFGKPIVVNFWATWCNPCTSEMPHFEEAYKKYGDKVHFLMVNVGDSRNEAKAFGEKNSYTFPIYHDSSYSASFAYNVSSIPGTLFINADGELVHSRVGALSKEVLISNIEKIKQ